MPNPLFNNQLQNQFQTFKSNPIAFLAQRNVNLPQNLINNPEGAVKYLLQNGQMSQDMFNQISQIANQLGLK
jgi:hypothetical protein